MGAILLSTLLSLWGIRLFTVLAAALGLISAVMAIFRRKGVNLPRTDFAALFLLSAALALLLAGNSRESLLAAQGQFAGKEAVSLRHRLVGRPAGGRREQLPPEKCLGHGG